MNRPGTIVSTLAGLLMASAAWQGAAAQCTYQKLVAADRGSSDHFGSSISSWYGQAGYLVGAPGAKNALNVRTGAVYVFGRTQVGTQVQTHKITPPDGGANDSFGTAVAQELNHTVIGSISAPPAGAAYFYQSDLFSPAPQQFLNPQKISSPVAQPDAWFGADVDLAENGGPSYAIVGSPGLSLDLDPGPGVNLATFSGAAYVYTKQGQSWNLVKTITDTGPQSAQSLGTSVSIESDYIAVGSLGGFVKLFNRVNAVPTWSPIGASRFIPADAQVGDGFGYSVAISNDLLIVGAPSKTTTAQQTPSTGATAEAGCVYVYRLNGANAPVLEQQIFSPDPAIAEKFGLTVHAAGIQLIVGTLRDRAYVLQNIAGAWHVVTTYRYPETGNPAVFGDSVSGNNETIAFAETLDGPNQNGAGAVFAYDFVYEGYPSDSCAAASDIFLGTISGCTNNATLGDTTTCGAGPQGYGYDVWYRFVAPCNGAMTLDTAGSNFDTVLSVHAACPEPGNSHTLSCNDDGFPLPSRDSRVQIGATAGSAYLIRVSGFNGQRGTFNLSISYDNPSANDACSSAQLIIAGTTPFNNCAAATDAAPIPAMTCATAGRDVWFRFVAPAAGMATIDTCGSQFDTVLLVYAGGLCNGAMVAMVCNDDVPDGCPGNTRTSRVQLSVQAGTPYLVRVGGFGPGSIVSTGEGVLTYAFAATCPCDFNGNGLAVSDIFDFLNAWFAGQASADFNGGGLSVQDIFDFLSCWFAGCS